MLTTYRRILAVPGALRFSATGLVGRLPISMEGLGIVLLVVAATDSYGYAGAVAGATTVANAVGTLVQGRYIDRLGQGRLLPPLILAWGLSLGLLVAAVHGDWPRWSVFGFAVVVGLSPAPGRHVHPGALVLRAGRPAPGADRLRAGVRRGRGGVHHRPDPGHRPGHGVGPGGRPRGRGPGRRRRHALPRRPARHRAARPPGRCARSRTGRGCRGARSSRSPWSRSASGRSSAPPR